MEQTLNGQGLLLGGWLPTPTAAHRTITALDGYCTPLSTDASWIKNPGGRLAARLWPSLVVRGCTVLADEPILELRTFTRNGAYVGYCDTATATRPRLQDATSIKCQKTVNLGVAYTDYSANVVDNNAGTVADLSNLDTVANGDWVVIGGPVPFCGAALDLTANVNTNVSVMTVEYWNGAAWAAVANLTDGTVAPAGTTLGTDGQISWDLPAAWVASTINTITAYWVRLSVSAALDAATEIAEIDLFGPITECIDVDTGGGDALVLVTAQTAAGLTGTLAYSGTIRVSWY